MALDKQTKALGIDPACSSVIAFFSQTVAFDDTFLNALVEPGAAYAKTAAGIANAKVFDRDGCKLGLCRARVQHMT